MYTFHRGDSGVVGTLPQTSTSWQINQSLTLTNYCPPYPSWIDNVFYLHVFKPCKQWSGSSLSPHSVSPISVEIFLRVGTLKIRSYRYFFNRGLNDCVAAAASSDCTSSWCYAKMTLRWSCRQLLTEASTDSLLAYCVVLWLFSCHQEPCRELLRQPKKKKRKKKSSCNPFHPSRCLFNILSSSMRDRSIECAAESRTVFIL